MFRIDRETEDGRAGLFRILPNGDVLYGINVTFSGGGNRGSEEVFGEGDHIGVLVRDRFPEYDNSFKGKQQYCFEHLKRDCKELLEKDPQNAEYH